MEAKLRVTAPAVNNRLYVTRTEDGKIGNNYFPNNIIFNIDLFYIITIIIVVVVIVNCIYSCIIFIFYFTISAVYLIFI